MLLAFKAKSIDHIQNQFISLSLQSLTSNTLTRKQLISELGLIRKTGYAIDREEFEIGLISLAVPIFNQDGILVAALSASGPANRFRETELNSYVSILKTGAKNIKSIIGNFKF